MRPARGLPSSLGGAAGSLALHGAALLAAVLLIGRAQIATEDLAAIVVFVPPEAPAVATGAPQLPPDFMPPPDEPPPPELRAVMPELPAPSEPPPPPDFKVPKPAATAPKVPRVPQQTPAPPTSSATPAPVPPPAAATSVAPNWNSALGAWLASHRRYPEAARRRSEEGDVTVRFTVAGDGRVIDVALVKSSGHDVLDAAALSMLKGASLPPPGTEATRTIRLRYRLAD